MIVPTMQTRKLARLLMSGLQRQQPGGGSADEEAVPQNRSRLTVAVVGGSYSIFGRPKLMTWLKVRYSVH